MRATAVAWVVMIASFTTYLRAADRSAQTIRLRTYWINRLGLECGRGDPLKVTMDDLVSWLANDSWSSETKKSARASVVVFYRWAVVSGRMAVTDNPAVDLPSITPSPPVPRPTPDQVLQAALADANHRDRLLLMLAGYGGLRRGEIARVHLDDFLWTDMELLVHGKGRRERLVPIHPDLAAAVLAEIDRRTAGGHGTGFRYFKGCRPDGYLFPGKHGHLTPDTVGRLLEQLLAGPWTGHTLRHRFATVGYSVDRDLRAMQELLGHSKPETTARYVRTPPKAKRAAVLAAGLNAA
ncbi:tyrosine-type recombinase/integrase [Kribbella catacumbae]|uniref:tyrosine-type recombinase/integrase n=1 Tax=Kribbella catacumbae TaxID=460086 RepID=UPI0004774773|nr:tyrosine-type recombinase/integrase [Kribbella catacumbae]